jgi:hypothetical protein
VPFGSTFASYLAALIFTGDDIPGIADNAASSPISDIEVSLHTASPASGNQTTSEATYTSYARVAVARSVSDYNETAGLVENDDPIVWPKATGGSSAVTHVACGTAHSGSGVVLVSGALTASLVVSNGVVPSIAIAGMSVTVG